LEHTGHAVDFLHPRRRQEKPKKWRRYVIPAVAAAVLLVGYIAYVQIKRASLTQTILELTAKSAILNKELIEANKVQDMVKEIDKWTATDVCWLDELERLCRKFPPANDAMLKKLIIGPGKNSKGGLIAMEGLAKSPASILSMEQGLNDPTHQVTNNGNNDDKSISPYTVEFKDQLSIGTAPPTAAKPAPAQPKRGK
jgi:hypothetical protein